MNLFTEGSHVRIDIPETTDPDQDRYHGIKGTKQQVQTVSEELAVEYADENGFGVRGSGSTELANAKGELFTELEFEL